MRQEVWGPPMFPAGPGHSPGKGSRGDKPHEALALFEIASVFWL